MTFPFETLSGASRETGFVIGTLIGFAFGFTLERAGFGRAPKLAAQFYGTDLTVLKVMFGAIVTALLGMIVLSGLGVVDFKAVADQAVSGTFLWPMIFGGFALGVGFIVSGYCPGTSFVAAASGKLDGLGVVVGVIAGQVIYAELEWRPLLSRFHNSGDLGHLYLWELAGLPVSTGPAVIAAVVTAMAIGAFVAAEKIEKRFAPGAASARRPRRAVFAGLATASAAGMAALLLPARTQARVRQPAPLSQLDLARRVLEQPWTVRVIDLRPREQCITRRVPGAECVPSASSAISIWPMRHRFPTWSWSRRAICRRYRPLQRHSRDGCTRCKADSAAGRSSRWSLRRRQLLTHHRPNTTCTGSAPGSTRP